MPRPTAAERTQIGCLYFAYADSLERQRLKTMYALPVAEVISRDMADVACVCEKSPRLFLKRYFPNTRRGYITGKGVSGPHAPLLLAPTDLMKAIKTEYGVDKDFCLRFMSEDQPTSDKKVYSADSPPLNDKIFFSSRVTCLRNKNPAPTTVPPEEAYEKLVLEVSEILEKRENARYNAIFLRRKWIEKQIRNKVHEAAYLVYKSVLEAGGGDSAALRAATEVYEESRL